jgi:nicotinate phosphoribosyltransferase
MIFRKSGLEGGPILTFYDCKIKLAFQMAGIVQCSRPHWKMSITSHSSYYCPFSICDGLDTHSLSAAFGGSFAVFCGLDECIQLLAHYRYSTEDIQYIRTLLPWAREEFFSQFLPSVDCSNVHVFAREDGSVALPSLPLLRVEGPLAVTQLLESTLLNLVNYASLVATNAAQHRIAAGDEALIVEFGLRRAQGPDGALHASKYCYLGGVDATSNVLAGQLYGIPVKGTHSHSFVQSFAGVEDLSKVRTILALNKPVAMSSAEFVREALNIRTAIVDAEDKPVDAELAAFASYAIS